MKLFMWLFKMVDAIDGLMQNCSNGVTAVLNQAIDKQMECCYKSINKTNKMTFIQWTECHKNIYTFLYFLNNFMCEYKTTSELTYIRYLKKSHPDYVYIAWYLIVIPSIHMWKKELISRKLHMAIIGHLLSLNDTLMSTKQKHATTCE